MGLRLPVLTNCPRYMSKMGLYLWTVPVFDRTVTQQAAQTFRRPSPQQRFVILVRPNEKTVGVLAFLQMIIPPLYPCTSCRTDKKTEKAGRPLPKEAEHNKNSRPVRNLRMRRLSTCRGADRPTAPFAAAGSFPTPRWAAPCSAGTARRSRRAAPALPGACRGRASAADRRQSQRRSRPRCCTTAESGR